MDIGYCAVYRDIVPYILLPCRVQGYCAVYRDTVRCTEICVVYRVTVPCIEICAVYRVAVPTGILCRIQEYILCRTQVHTYTVRVSGIMLELSDSG